MARMGPPLGGLSAVAGIATAIIFLPAAVAKALFSAAGMAAAATSAKGGNYKKRKQNYRLRRTKRKQNYRLRRTKRKQNYRLRRNPWLM
jgi:hypothetical protein